MFSIVPVNVSARSDKSNRATLGDVTGSTKLLVPGRVTAATSIPQGAMTVSINPKLITGPSEIIQLLVGTNTFGTIELTDSSRHIWNKKLHWIRALRLSDDCHNYNIQLKLQPSSSKNHPVSKLILQTVRPIQAGQELLLWFSEDILAMMQMVFLTPANIQGQKKYVCIRCSTLYESPNPLKLHIILGCGRQSISALWDRISQILLESNKYNSLDDPSFTEFTFKLTPTFSATKQKSAIDLSCPQTSNIKRPTSQPSYATNYYTSCPSVIEETKVLYRPYSEPPVTSHSSAFKPFQKIQAEDNVDSKPALVLHNSLSSPPYLQRFNFKQGFYTPNNLYSNVHYNDEAQIETLVSTLGKSKEGHICLYCGKCYSRKYGLKIHIRTHTGYKPLKCKFCLRPFGDPSNLNKHVRLHAEGETPYKCDLCGKILVRRRDLERHLKSRHMGDIYPGRSIIEGERTSESSVANEDNPALAVDS